MRWDDTDCSGNGMQRAVSKRSCDAMRPNEMNLQKRGHQHEKSRDCCCDAQKAWPHPIGSVGLHCITLTLSFTFTLACTHYHRHFHLCQPNITLRCITLRYSTLGQIRMFRLHYAILKINYITLGAHTRTHLLRTVIENSDVECILRAKTLQLNLTGIG